MINLLLLQQAAITTGFVANTENFALGPLHQARVCSHHMMLFFFTFSQSLQEKKARFRTSLKEFDAAEIKMKEAQTGMDFEKMFSVICFLCCLLLVMLFLVFVFLQCLLIDCNFSHLIPLNRRIRFIISTKHV
jgi:hypothetical protein